MLSTLHRLPDFRPGLYWHKKGALYQALSLALDEATLKPVVIYQQVEGEGVDGVMWVRLLESWNEVVEWPDGVRRSRFSWAGDDGAACSSSRSSVP